MTYKLPFSPYIYARYKDEMTMEQHTFYTAEQMQEAYAAGCDTANDAKALEGKHRAELDACIAALPGPYYMDPPDGGSVSVDEQVARMAKDAARYRWLCLNRMMPWGHIGLDQAEIIEHGIDAVIDIAMETVPAFARQATKLYPRTMSA